MRAAGLALLVPLLALGPLHAQKAKEPPNDPQLSEHLKRLKSLVKDRKMTGDFTAISLMQKLDKELEKKNSKDKKKIVKALGGVFTTGKVREGARDVLYREAADLLAKLGEQGGAKALAKSEANKRFDDNVSLRAHLLKALGKTEDADHIDYLLDVTTRSHIDALRAASGEALSNFTKAKLRQKREIVEQIIRTWGSLHSDATRAVNLDPNEPVDFNPQNARRILRACEGHWIRTLQKLTGVSQSKFPEWQRWLNKNRGWKPPA
ncbi:MAG: HEAT repeat domain-containing protein [Planctomycetota bacterium]